MSRTTFLTEQRALLVARLAQTRRRLSAVDAHLQNADREMPNDFADRATERQNDETLEALEALSREEIPALEAAIARIDAGTFGVCLRCGALVSEARLRAVPDASFCISCAT